MNLSDTEWEDQLAVPTGAELVDQALLVAAAKRRLTARLDKAADAQIAALLDGTTDYTAPVVPGMAGAVAQALRELEDDQLEQDAAAAHAELNAVADHATADAEPQLYYGSLPEFVGQFLVRAYRREIAARRTWCKQWWKHPEVTGRLDALWRSWEALRLEPGTGMSVWWRDHADHHMPRILDPDGPFKGCTTEGHQTNGKLEPLPWGQPARGAVRQHRTDSTVSLAGDLVKEAGTVALGVAGIVGTYLSSRTTAREARQHARIEAIYVELIHQLNLAGHWMKDAARGEFESTDWAKDRTAKIDRLVSELKLYGSPDLMEHVVAVLMLQAQTMDLVRACQAANPPPEEAQRRLSKAISAMDDRHEVLVRTLRADLAVPGMPARRRVHRWLGGTSRRR